MVCRDNVACLAEGESGAARISQDQSPCSMSAGRRPGDWLRAGIVIGNTAFQIPRPELAT
jgi:hypothetical protein